MEFTAIYYLIPSLIMFCCGVYGFITRKNMIAILISLELMLNSVDINFVVFNRFLFPNQLEGNVLHAVCISQSPLSKQVSLLRLSLTYSALSRMLIFATLTK